jgi:hypothetical protein
LDGFLSLFDAKQTSCAVCEHDTSKRTCDIDWFPATVQKSADSGEAARPAQGTTLDLIQQARKQIADLTTPDIDDTTGNQIHVCQACGDAWEDEEHSCTMTMVKALTDALESPPVLPPALTRETLAQAVREAFGPELLPQVRDILINALMKAPKLAPLVAGATWQPIATAPKDGTPIRLKWDKTTVEAIGRWCPANEWPKPYATDDWRDVKGNDVLLMPTHWMPLPPLPSGAASGAEKE